MGAHLLGEQVPMKMFLLPIMGGFEEVSDSAFRYEACVQCGTPIRIQERDLRVRRLSGGVQFSTTLDGDLIAARSIAESIAALGPDVELRPAVVDGDGENWYQIIAARCLEPSQQSLRSPRVTCSACGGVARVQVGIYPPLRVANPKSEVIHFATVCGAPLMTLISAVVLDVLERVNVGFFADEIELEP